MTLVFRKMQLADISLVAAIHAENAFPWPPAAFTECLQAGYENWVIEQNHEIIGFAILMLCLDEAELLQIAIKKAYQRRGHASYLLQFAFSEMQKNAIKKIFLEVRASNTVAQAFYERLGFEKIAIRRHYYLTSNGREDAWIYCLENFIACQQGF